ncbi:hypothetical protein GCM10010493_59990 [Streptomyces lavendulae subsp. grasserius]
MAEMPLSDHIRRLRQRQRQRQRQQCHMVADRPQTDDLAVSAVDLRPPQRRPGSLIAPVHLGLGPWQHLEPAMEPCQSARADARFLRDAGPGFLQAHLDPLARSIASINGATSSTTRRYGCPLGALRGSATGVSPDR